MTTDEGWESSSLCLQHKLGVLHTISAKLAFVTPRIQVTVQHSNINKTVILLH